MSDRNFRKRVLLEARSWCGTPYKHQTSLKGEGADCLGLIRGIWRKLYGQEPPHFPAYTRDWGEVGQREHLLESAKKWLEELDENQARAGDLVVFRWQRHGIAKHMGILSGRANFIHAYEKAGTVETVMGSHWRTRIVGWFRFPTKRI